jgi:hypothetical protein
MVNVEQSSFDGNNQVAEAWDNLSNDSEWADYDMDLANSEDLGKEPENSVSASYQDLVENWNTGEEAVNVARNALNSQISETEDASKFDENGNELNLEIVEPQSEAQPIKVTQLEQPVTQPEQPVTQPVQSVQLEQPAQSQSLENVFDDGYKAPEQPVVQEAPRSLKIEVESYSEEDRNNYEAMEKSYKEALVKSLDERMSVINPTGDLICDAMFKAQLPFASRLRGHADNFTNNLDKNSKNTLDSLFTFVDTVYPSKYSEGTYTQEQINAAAKNFDDTSRREPAQANEDLGLAANDLVLSDEMNGMRVHNELRGVGDKMTGFQDKLRNAIFACLKEPTKENLMKIAKIGENDHSVAGKVLDLNDSFRKFNLGCFDNVVTSTLVLMENSKKYCDDLAKYIEFKVSNSKNIIATSPNVPAAVTETPSVAPEPQKQSLQNDLLS